MNLTTKKINLHRTLFSSATLASMLGGMILSVNNPVQAQYRQQPRHYAENQQKQGQSYVVGNNSGINVNYEIQYINKHGQLVREKGLVGSNQQNRFFSLNAPLVTFDSTIGPGYTPTALPLTPGNNNFDRQGNSLIFSNGDNGVVTNNVKMELK